MKLHRDAALSWNGRRVLARRVVSEGWTLTAAAEAAGVSVRCARKWVGRYRQTGEPGLIDRSSAPRRVANRTPLRDGSARPARTRAARPIRAFAAGRARTRRRQKAGPDPGRLAGEPAVARSTTTKPSPTETADGARRSAGSTSTSRS